MSTSELSWAMVHRLEEAAVKMDQAAERMEMSAQRIAFLLEDGYGGNGLRLIELLETTNSIKEAA